MSHWLVGRKAVGFAFLLGSAILVLLYWPMRLPGTYAGLQVLMWLAIVLCGAAAWSALRCRSKLVPTAPARWLLILLPFALLASFAHDNWLLRVAGFRIFTIPSTGMEPTVIKGERIVADLRRYRSQKPVARDVIVIRKGSDHYLKRVIATEGTSIRGERGAILVNERPLDELYVQHIGDAPAELTDFGPQIVPIGKLFVMGDNRDVSRDSRLPDFGLVDNSEVEGKALYLISPNRRRLGKGLR